MPLTHKGKKVMAALAKQYHDKEKVKSVFYAMINKGTLKGAHK
jgi:hypothetical protein